MISGAKEHMAMNRVLGGILISAVMAVPLFAALKQNDKAPDFSAKASLAGKEFNFSLKDALKKGPVVVYFYPSAYTGGCENQNPTIAGDKKKNLTGRATISVGPPGGPSRLMIVISAP